MHASETRTLLEDWQVRRESLSKEPDRAEQSAEMQLRILSYLIHRYGDSSEAARPARFIPKSEFYVDERTIVVHHHAWQDELGGSKNRREAESRVADALHRLTSRKPHETSWPLPHPPGKEAWPSSKGAVDRRNWKNVVQKIRAGRTPDRDIVKALMTSRIAPREVVEHLYLRLMIRASASGSLAQILLACGNREAVLAAYRAWRERRTAGWHDEAYLILKEHFSQPGMKKRIAITARLALADTDPVLRLAAVNILAQVGTLDDIGLISDLLSLKPQPDEDPFERPALVEAMRAIAESD